jgi:hypothetical protein
MSLAAFGEWWSWTVQQLTEALRTTLWPRRASYGLTDLALFLSRQLNRRPLLAGLVQQKNGQLDNCGRQLRRWSLLPVPQEWVEPERCQEPINPTRSPL